MCGSCGGRLEDCRTRVADCEGIVWLTQCALEAVQAYDARAMERLGEVYSEASAARRIETLSGIVLNGPKFAENMLVNKGTLDAPDSWDANPLEWRLRRV